MMLVLEKTISFNNISDFSELYLQPVNIHNVSVFFRESDASCIDPSLEKELSGILITGKTYRFERDLYSKILNSYGR